jgi:hypothetical protein
VIDETAASEGIARYRTLGLLANPFPLSDDTDLPDALDTDIAAHANVLLGAIDSAANDETARPIWVSKLTGDIPSYYPLRAISMAERVLATDDSLDVLHAYVQLYVMKNGRIRATLNAVAERLAFRSFEKTLALYVSKILAEPDQELISYRVLGAEGLAAFGAQFELDADQAIEAIFGTPELERRPELEEVADTRLVRMEKDVDEDNESPELDSTVGNAPGVGVVEVEAEETAEETNQQALDYLVEYTKVHLSPVIARALRVYKERGLAALAAEFKVTKAPRKTLAALARLARVRFRKVVVVYDGFEGWPSVPQTTRSLVMTALLEIRWLLEHDGLVIIMLERNEVPELEEQFSSANRIDWDFEGVVRVGENPHEFDRELLSNALRAAARPGAIPMTLDDPVLKALMDAAEGNMLAALTKARAAVESAADRGVSSLDDQALQAGLAAEFPDTAE